MTEKAKVWLYCPTLEIKHSLSGNVAETTRVVDSSPTYKHWALVIEFLQNGTLEPEFCEIWEATRSDGFLVARHKPLKLSEWKNYKDEDKTEFEIIDFDRDPAEDFCRVFNERRLKYIAFEENCQTFVKELTIEIGISSLLPTQAVENRSFWDRTSVGSSGLVRPAITHALGATPAILDDVFSWIYKMVAGKPLEKLIILSSSEIKKRWLHGLNGAVSYWQLLQIPVEILTKNMLEQVGYDDIEAYGGSKLASFITAAAIGNIVAPGGPGLAASIALWVAAELISYLIRKGLEKATKGKCNLIFGESQTELLVKRIFYWTMTKLNAKVIADGVKQVLTADDAEEVFPEHIAQRCLGQ